MKKSMYLVLIWKLYMNPQGQNECIKLHHFINGTRRELVRQYLNYVFALIILSLYSFLMNKKFDYQIIVINVQENKKKCCLPEYIKHNYIKLLMLALYIECTKIIIHVWEVIKLKKKIIFNTFMAVSIKNTFAVFYKQSFLFFLRYWITISLFFFLH